MNCAVLPSCDSYIYRDHLPPHLETTQTKRLLKTIRQPLTKHGLLMHCLCLTSFRAGCRTIDSKSNTYVSRTLVIKCCNIYGHIDSLFFLKELWMGTFSWPVFKMSVHLSVDTNVLPCWFPPRKVAEDRESSLSTRVIIQTTFHFILCESSQICITPLLP